MGVTTSKLSCASSTTAHEPSLRVNAVSTMSYSLPFRVCIERWKKKHKVRMHHFIGARRMLKDIFLWEDWLGSTMRDAAQDTIEDFLGISVNPENLPEVVDICIEIDPIQKKSYNKITGVIHWRSIAVNKKRLDHAINWRLGDRMCQYGIQNDEEKWICFFHPGLVIMESYSTKD